MRHLHRTPSLLLGMLLLLAMVGVAQAANRTVTGVSAVHHDGQTFVTWDAIPTTGWTYHVYRLARPIGDQIDLYDAEELGTVGDSSAVDRRMSSLLGRLLTYSTDSLATPLAPSRGLFVVTPGEAGLYSYAVLAESLGLGQTVRIVPGQNAMTEQIWERTEKPRPIFQRTLTSPVHGDDYVLFTSNRDTPQFPAMSNQSCFAAHVGIIRGTRGGGLVLHGHGRGGSFFNSLTGTGTPGEWVMAIDDYLPTSDAADFYFGYHEDYDWNTQWNPPAPPYSVVADYSDQRVLYLLDWASNEFQHDRNRVYAMGSSMGGSFAFFLAWHHPERIAGALAFIPKLCFGYGSDTAPWLRDSFDRMWGTVSDDLPTTNGSTIYEWMDGRSQAEAHQVRGSAPLVGFCGRNDDVVGWSEKVAYFQQMQQAHAGGTWFWDTRGHYDAQASASWAPMQSWKQLYRFRLDQSYPALSNCSADGVLGSGAASDGDSVGTVNGAVDWDTNILDSPTQWSVTLRTRSLKTRYQTFAQPTAAYVDVTPRRLQQFLVSDRATYAYTVVDANTHTMLQSGEVRADDSGVLTIPQVAVTETGAVLTIAATSTLGVAPGVASGLHLALSNQPVRGDAKLRVTWPATGAGTVEMFDVSGRRERTLFAGIAHGSSELALSPQGLAPGVYLVRARQGAATATQRVVVLH